MQIDAVEAALARLMPPALSQQCQDGLDSLIDELDAERPEPVAVTHVPSSPRRIGWGVGLAAGLAGLAALTWNASTTLPMVADDSVPATRQAPPAWVLVGEADRIESVTDEGWQEDANGSTLHTVRLSVVEENSIQDAETGMVVLVSEPREEILYTPISAF